MNCNCSATGYEPLHILTEKIVTARQEHICCECDAIIKPGQKYEYVKVKDDERPVEIYTFKTCLPCVGIRRDYCPDGFLYGGLRWSIEECLDFDYTQVPKYDEEEEDEM